MPGASWPAGGAAPMAGANGAAAAASAEPASSVRRVMSCILFSRLSSRRQSQLDLQAGRVVEQFDARVVKAGNGGDEAQPQSVAGRASRPLEPVKTPEHVPVLVNRNPRAIVGDRDHRVGFASAKLH